MSKKTLNLSIEEHIKERAKRMARKRGKSVSRFFEELIANQEECEFFVPSEGTAAYELSQILPESKKEENPDYERLRERALKEKYGGK